MKRMNQEQLQSLYPPMTEDFSARMERMIRSLPSRKEEMNMNRNIHWMPILIIVLVLVTLSTAVAAGLGVFGQLANTHDPDSRMNDLEALASPVQQTVVTDDGVTVTIDQAYYDGTRVFISYRITGSLVKTETGHGDPGNLNWIGGNYDVVIDPDSPTAEALLALRNGETGDWLRVTTACLSDGLFFQDGTYLDIIGGDIRLLPDGTVLGWKECEVPVERTADTLACKAVLFRSASTYQKTDQGLRSAFERVGENTDIPFTVRRDEEAIPLTGESTVEGVYQARAALFLSRLDLKGEIQVKAPAAWMKALLDWDFSEANDLIMDWALYAGSERIDTPMSVDGIGPNEDGLLCYRLLMRHGGQTADLRLVPVYEYSGEHPEEAIPLVRAE